MFAFVPSLGLWPEANVISDKHYQHCKISLEVRLFDRVGGRIDRGPSLLYFYRESQMVPGISGFYHARDGLLSL